LLPAESVNDLVDSIAGKRGPYKAGRTALRARLISLVRQVLRDAGRFEATEPWLEREISSSDTFRSLLDRLWPSVSPQTVVREVLTSPDLLARAAAGVLSPGEVQTLSASRQRRATRAWSADDVPLLDGAAYLVHGQSATYGHIVVDEAQDLSPMQFRMVARRAPAGSLTILGDLAQATGAWSYDGWDEILHHLPSVLPTHLVELTLGYRAPGQVLDLASRLLPVAAPNVTPTRSIRRGRDEPRFTRVAQDRLMATGLGESLRLAGEGYLVGLVVAPEHMVEMADLTGAEGDVGALDDNGMTRPVTLVAATAVKGLEFDAVVVVEPAAIAAGGVRGLRLLYVAMTRPIRHLSIVHAEPLPLPLSAG
jgi:DNA helicase IV